MAADLHSIVPAILFRDGIRRICGSSRSWAELLLHWRFQPEMDGLSDADGGCFLASLSLTCVNLPVGLCNPPLPVFASVLRYKLGPQRLTVCVLLYRGMYRSRLSYRFELFSASLSSLCFCPWPMDCLLWRTCIYLPIPVSGKKRVSTPFAGTDASLPKHDWPQMLQWMEYAYATVQPCNAA